MNINLLTNLDHSLFFDHQIRSVKRVTNNDEIEGTVIKLIPPHDALVITPRLNPKVKDYINWLLDNIDIKSTDNGKDLVDLLSKELAFTINNPDYPYRIGIFSSSKLIDDSSTIIPCGNTNIEIIPVVEDEELVDIIKRHTVVNDIRNSIRTHIQTYYMMKC